MPTTEPASFQNPGVLPDASASEALGAGEVFTSPWVNVSYFASVVTAVSTDQSGTLAVQFSPDTINIDSTLTYSVIAGAIEPPHRLTVARKWMRVVYTNGAVAQTYMRLQSMAGFQTQLSAPKNLVLQQDADAIATRDTSFDLEVAEGKREGYLIVNKFGANPDIDSGSVPEDIWTGGGVYSGFPLTANETLQVFSSNANDTIAGTGARTAQIFGLDIAGAVQTETVELSGTTAVTTTQQFWRVNRVIVKTSGNNNQNFNAGDITIRGSVTTSNIFAIVPASSNQTQMAIYTIPANTKGYLKNLDVEILRSNTAAAEGCIWLREPGCAPRLTRLFSLSQSDSLSKSVYGGIAYEPLTDIAIRITSMSANNVQVSAYFDLLLVDN